MERYLTIHKTALAVCTRREYDWVIEVFKDSLLYTVLCNENTLFVPVEWTADILERTLDTDDFEVIGLITFLHELANAGMMWVVLKVSEDREGNES